MKKQILLLLLSLGISLGTVVGQNKPNSYARWHIKPALGINFTLNRLLSGEITDNLIAYDDNSYYWQFLSGTYFFNPKWGIEFTFQASTSSTIATKADLFEQQITATYQNDYFITQSSGAQYRELNVVEGDISKGYIGLVYRHEQSRFIFMPKLFLGINSFYTNWGRAYLKEKDAHTILELFYETDEHPQDHFTLVPAATIGIRISKHLIANLDVMYVYYPTRFQFTEQTRNTLTEAVSTRIIDYRKNLHSITAGIGLIVEFGYETPSWLTSRKR